MRILLFATIFGLSHEVKAGDIRHVPPEQRVPYLELLALTFGLTAFTSLSALNSLWHDQWFYDPIVITTSERIDITISQAELVYLQQHSAILAEAITTAPDQHHIRLPISALFLSLLTLAEPNVPNGINPIFLRHKLATLQAMKDEADSLQCKYLSEQIAGCIPKTPQPAYSSRVQLRSATTSLLLPKRVLESTTESSTTATYTKAKKPSQ